MTYGDVSESCPAWGEGHGMRLVMGAITGATGLAYLSYGRGEPSFSAASDYDFYSYVTQDDAEITFETEDESRTYAFSASSEELVLFDSGTGACVTVFTLTRQ